MDYQPETLNINKPAQTQGPFRDLALHTLGWKAFQDLCAQICEEVLQRKVAVYREAQDGGQDAVFSIPCPNVDKTTHTGTVQCKFTSDSHRRLKSGDLNEEKANIRSLVDRGEAHAYYFITNMGVDAPIAAEIKECLRNIGVQEPEVFGREWITTKIRESARLRALVPRIYGLGDLSIILDERRADQTLALLGHLMPALSVYVPTAAHRNAVRVLSEHGIVLLLGAPATGKSMLAAILATTALDGDGHRCFQVDSPHELIHHWDPNTPGGFYWIDDAFGPNQLRNDYVDCWIAMMNKVKAAISRGNRFVLTSRSHIWSEAKQKLATRNLPQFADNSAIVNVGILSPEERSQILYNHIKSGNQSVAWKRRVKPYLASIAMEHNLLPEIARRLGDQSYTAGLTKFPDDLTKFVVQPMEYLKDTINELNDAQQAALTLVFLYRSKLPVDLRSDKRLDLVGNKFAVNQVEIGNALNQLNGTFVIQKSEAASKIWCFAHPTIADALSDILGHRPDLVELYVSGTRIETLLSEIVCADAKPIRNAIVVTESVNDLLIMRLLETPDERNLNRTLFAFLAERASDAVLFGVLKEHSAILERETPYCYAGHLLDSKTRLFARAHALGLLPPYLRLEAVDCLEKAIFNNLDGSFLDNDAILALFPPTRLLPLSLRLWEELLDTFPDFIEEVVERADLSIDPEDNFETERSFVETMNGVFADSDRMQERIMDLKGCLTTAIKEVSEKQEESKKTDVEWQGYDISPSKVTAAAKGSRSLFSDVDE